jgi:hypothetical protein|tara:strand:- start:322 stop:555 length:234 start_codon:yes stop_codon:yes gene_type:complete
MKYQLVMKNTGEIITITDRKLFGLDEAKAYYIRMKQLKEKDFDKLYVVEKYKRPKGMPPVHKEIKWWRDETTNLDDF